MRTLAYSNWPTAHMVRDARTVRDGRLRGQPVTPASVNMSTWCHNLSRACQNMSRTCHEHVTKMSHRVTDVSRTCHENVTSCRRLASCRITWPLRCRTASHACSRLHGCAAAARRARGAYGALWWRACGAQPKTWAVTTCHGMSHHVTNVSQTCHEHVTSCHEHVTNVSRTCHIMSRTCHIVSHSVNIASPHVNSLTC